MRFLLLLFATTLACIEQSKCPRSYCQEVCIKPAECILFSPDICNICERATCIKTNVTLTRDDRGDESSGLGSSFQVAAVVCVLLLFELF